MCGGGDIGPAAERAQGALVHAANLGEEVPVIIHRDNIISDYDQIIDYVERTFTGGTTAAQAQTAPSLENLRTHPPTPTQAWSPRQGTTGYRPGSDTSRILRSPRGPPLGVLGL